MIYKKIRSVCRRSRLLRSRMRKAKLPGGLYKGYELSGLDCRARRWRVRLLAPDCHSRVKLPSREHQILYKETKVFVFSNQTISCVCESFVKIPGEKTIPIRPLRDIRSLSGISYRCHYPSLYTYKYLYTHYIIPIHIYFFFLFVCILTRQRQKII